MMKPGSEPAGDHVPALSGTGAAEATPHLERKLGLLNATSINMSNMVGSGTFVTLPLLLTAMGGPQALISWFLGAVIALADGLVLSELAAALPGSGGPYVYLREARNGGGFGPFSSCAR